MADSLPDQRTFGPYVLSEQDEGHLVVWRADGQPAEPAWYELQTMARMAWGQGALAVEIFPPGRELVDGQHQRHLWLVPGSLEVAFPSLHSGRRWSNDGACERCQACEVGLDEVRAENALGAAPRYGYVLCGACRDAADLRAENERLRELLKRAYRVIGNDELAAEISLAVDGGSETR